MTPVDIYATAKTNLRDNVKTLITVFSAVAGVLLAGTPFSGFGALDSGSPRFIIAAISLLSAAVVITLSLRRLLKVLQPDLAYSSALDEDFNVKAAPKDHRAELNALRDEFQARKRELLPGDFDSIKKLNESANKSWAHYEKVVAGKQDGPGQASTSLARQAYDELVEAETKINQWAAFTRLHFRIRKGTDVALGLGLLALIFVGTFSWAVGGAKEKPSGPPVIVIGDIKPAFTATASFPPIEPIAFATDKWSLSQDSIRTIGKARDFLRSNTDSGVLVYSYTDTKGSSKVNRRLATKRAEAVTQALITEGGVSSFRVFVTKQSESDLPVLTAKESENQTNRAVQLVLIPIPQRK